MAVTPSIPMQASTRPGVVAGDLLALVGRILIAVMFIPEGVAKLMGFAGTVGYIASKGMPLPELGAAGAIVVELGVGLAFLLGYKTRIAACVLALFTLAASIIFHDFWALPEAQRAVQTLLFMKNIAVIGGLLGFAGLGAGRLSLDRR